MTAEASEFRLRIHASHRLPLHAAWWETRQMVGRASPRPSFACSTPSPLAYLSAGWLAVEPAPQYSMRHRASYEHSQALDVSEQQEASRPCHQGYRTSPVRGTVFRSPQVLSPSPSHLPTQVSCFTFTYSLKAFLQLIDHMTLLREEGGGVVPIGISQD